VRTTHTKTYNTIDFADLYKRCTKCGRQVTGVLCITGKPWPNIPCEHVGYEDTCPSWSPVDGCRCETPCEVPHAR
jgi:hypothetical protein